MKIKKSVINKIKDKQKEKDRIYELYKNACTVITKDEMHRLKKVLKNEDKEQKLRDWVHGVYLQIDNRRAKEYNDFYKETLSEVIDIMNITIIYTLHFNHCCNFGEKRIADFMQDYFVTYNLFTSKELNADVLLKQLKDDGIDASNFLESRR